MALITLIVFLPTLGALAIAFMPSKKDENGVNEKDNQNLLLGSTLAVGILTFVVSLAALVFMEDSAIDENIGEMQHAFSVSWIDEFDI